MVEPVGGLECPAQGEVTREDDVLAVEGDDQGALNRPRADSRNGRELGEDVLVGPATEPVGVQPAVGESFSEVAQCGDLSPGQAGVPE